MTSFILNSFNIIKLNFSKLSFLLLLLLFVSFNLTAQGTNPFDLEKYSPDTLKNTKQDDKNIFEFDDSVTTPHDNSNPFEISGLKKNDSKENKNLTKNYTDLQSNTKQLTQNNNPFDFSENPPSQKETKKENKKNQINKGQIKKIENFSTGNNDFLLWVFLFVLVLIALLMTTNRQLVLKIFKTVWFYNLTNILFRNFGNREVFFYLLIYINFVVNLGIYFYLLVSHYYGYNSEFIFMMFVLLVLSVYIIKHLGLYLFNLIFPKLKKIKVYSFTTTIFNISLGISLIPINILIAYGLPIIVKIALILGAITIVIFYLLRLLRGFLITIDYYNYSKFHYFLYLCALEFIPIIFLYKFVLNFL